MHESNITDIASWVCPFTPFPFTSVLFGPDYYLELGLTILMNTFIIFMYIFTHRNNIGLFSGYITNAYFTMHTINTFIFQFNSMLFDIYLCSTRGSGMYCSEKGTQGLHTLSMCSSSGLQSQTQG